MEVGCFSAPRLTRVSARPTRDTLLRRPRCVGPRGHACLGSSLVGGCRRRSLCNPARYSPGGVLWHRCTSIGPRGRGHRASRFSRTRSSDLHGRQSLRARYLADRSDGTAHGRGIAHDTDRVSGKPNHRRHPRPSHLARAPATQSSAGNARSLLWPEASAPGRFGSLRLAGRARSSEPRAGPAKRSPASDPTSCSPALRWRSPPRCARGAATDHPESS